MVVSHSRSGTDQGQARHAGETKLPRHRAVLTALMQANLRFKHMQNLSSGVLASQHSCIVQQHQT